MSLPAGARLGPHEVLSSIGAGGMGEVYRARDPRLGRKVAIKVLPAFFDPDRLRRFEREAHAAGGLTTPISRRSTTSGRRRARPYVVMELLRGETLRQRLGSGPIPARKAVDYGIQVARGLAAAPAAPDVVLANNYRKVFRSTDGAKTWTVVSGIPQTTRVRRIVADPAGTLWAGTEEGIYKSSDGGAAWSIAGRGAETADVQVLLVDLSTPGTIFEGTWKKGILRTTDGGKTWTCIGGDPPHPDAVALALEKGPPRALLVGFGGGSVLRLDLEAAGTVKPSAPASKRR